ncbi:hypothetical protein HPB51_000125 [Rhipicephalus microplus]|uniref:Uncharacterized protein n=1 Tax=Rhipicephalus microplus TaxID=6941 RepID=A0A9J6DXN0_RHIMP|nr:hypothetical protein HPB51_000125 [Rhipicephalus microplus]
MMMMCLLKGVVKSSQTVPAYAPKMSQVDLYVHTSPDDLRPRFRCAMRREGSLVVEKGMRGLLSNTLGFRSTRSRGSLSGHSAAITSRTIGQRLPVPTWLAHTRSGMSEPQAVSVQPPMAGSHPGPGDSPRSNGSTFSPDGDRALLDVDLQNAPVTSVAAIPDVTNIQLPAAVGEAQNGPTSSPVGPVETFGFSRCGTLGSSACPNGRDLRGGSRAEHGAPYRGPARLA